MLEGAVAQAKARIGAWFREHGADLANVLFLGALTALVYTLDLDSIGIGGDAIRKWHFVRQWFHHNHFAHARWDHHMARIGMNAIAFVSQVILGRGPLVYYVPALAAGVVSAMTVYACGKRLGSRMVGVLAALGLVAFKPAHTASTQFLPEVFSGTYAIVAGYFFIRYAQATSRRLAWLSAVSVSLFVAYLAKETALFFVPGFVLAVWLVGRETRWRDAAILLGILAVGALLETATFALFTDYQHRFAVVSEQHNFDPSPDDVLPGFFSLFVRYAKALPEWQVAFYAFLPAALAVALFSRDPTSVGLVLSAASYFFFLTFLVRRVNPLVVWQSFHSRYLDCGAPFVFLILALFLRLVARAISGKVAAIPRLLERLSPLARARNVVVPVLCVAIGVVTYLRARPHLDEHPFAVLPREAAVLNDAYRRNLPIYSTRNVNGLWAAYSVLLDDRLLDKDGVLPAYDEAKLFWNKQMFLLRDPTSYNPDKVRRLIRRRCAVEVNGKAGYFSVRPRTNLPPECDQRDRERERD